MSKALRIFLSSTWQDLQPERQAVEKALHRMSDTTFSGMEYIGSRSETPKDASLAEVDLSDIYVGIFGLRYGSGITEAEYRRARELNLPCLIYLKDEAMPIPPTHIERDPHNVAKLEALKRELKANHTVSFFTSPDHLASQVAADLHNLLKVSSSTLDPPTSRLGAQHQIMTNNSHGIVIDDHPTVTQQTGRMDTGGSVPAEESMTATRAVAAQLYQLLIERFDEEELRTLCFRLGVEYDDLRGEGRSARARELVKLLQRRRQLDRLQTTVRQLFGDVT